MTGKALYPAVMRQIVLYEFTVSGGLWRKDENYSAADSLIREGRAMLTALATDFAAIEGVETLVLRDCRGADWPITRCTVCDVKSAADEQSLLCELSSQAAATILIAPEFDGLLLERCRWVEQRGGKLLSPTSRVVEIASDKQQTGERLALHGIPTPRSIVLQSGDALPLDFHYPAVIKPIDGCGSQDVQLISERLPAATSALRFCTAMRLEEFVPGAPASVVVLCGPNELRPLAACHQRLSDDGRFQYLGGSLPLPTQLAKRAQKLAVRAVATLPQPRGYIGVDLVLGDDPTGCDDVVIEINPRLTASYIGLRAAARCNLAEAMWAIAEGRPAEVSFSDMHIEFDSDGAVWQARR
jgi:predicted ATP-grasp superfamily ATP-dependent carboligase